MEKYSRNEQIIDGELDDNQVMMHLDKGKYFGLDPVAKRIWELIEEPKNITEITSALLEEFEVSAEQCKQEVKIFLDKAIQFDIIKSELA
ncbi:PqqD family protein [Flavobacterium sp. GSA192]|uniref:PqqD family protein n=1 Tax=Flavobacterium sp. GSA192 TaxID=2576304 RepID=UPI00112C4440|nr:PqqD family protein [Flavobacterium sp. GSA192]